MQGSGGGLPPSGEPMAYPEIVYFVGMKATITARYELSSKFVRPYFVQRHATIRSLLCFASWWYVKHASTGKLSILIILPRSAV